MVGEKKEASLPSAGDENRPEKIKKWHDDDGFRLIGETREEKDNSPIMQTYTDRQSCIPG